LKLGIIQCRHIFRRLRSDRNTKKKSPYNNDYRNL